MTIPKLQGNSELPEGEHLASLDEIEVVYGSFTGRRKELMKGLRDASTNLEAAGVRTIWINDIDGCWEYTRLVDINLLDPIFLGNRIEMKKKYGLDFFISNIIEADSGLPFPKFFQKNRDGDPKGIIVVKLGE